MFSEVQMSMIRGALQQKGVKVCPACQVGPWTVGADFVMLPLAPTSMIGFMGQAMPNIPIICNHCGFTQLHNVFALGLAEVLGVKPSQISAAAGSHSAVAPMPKPSQEDTFRGR